MHAVLLVSAKHLSYLSPGDSEYQKASLFHLSKVLPRYRGEVANPLSTKNADCAMAASFLLLYFVWSDVDTSNVGNEATFTSDQLFTMMPGAREMFISATSLIISGKSIFSECIAHHPREAIDETARKCARPPFQFEKYFCELYCRINGDSIADITSDSGRNMRGFTDSALRNGKLNHNDLWYAITQPYDPCIIGFLDAVIRLAPLASIVSDMRKGKLTRNLVAHPL